MLKLYVFACIAEINILLLLSAGLKTSPASLMNEQNRHQMLHTSDKDEQPKAKKCSHCMLPSKRPIFTSCSNWSCDRARLFHFVSIEATGVSTFGPSYTVHPQLVNVLQLRPYIYGSFHLKWVTITKLHENLKKLRNIKSERK